MYGADFGRGRINAFRVRLLRGEGVSHTKQSAVPGNGAAELGRRVLHSGELQS